LSIHIDDADLVDIEEITHKAGNFKKFSLFTKMLGSGFAKASDSVFVDLLTFADLEVLKARKTG
jgi:coiled-coil domain-containing protein 61